MNTPTTSFNTPPEPAVEKYACQYRGRRTLRTCEGHPHWRLLDRTTNKWKFVCTGHVGALLTQGREHELQPLKPGPV